VNQRALFLDRDGVVNRDHGYVHRVQDVEWIDGIFDLCRAFQSAGYVIAVVTNQAGVARGLYTEAAVVELHRWMTAEFQARGVAIGGFYYCPHHPQGSEAHYAKVCDCRKPAPGMLLRAQRELGLDLAASVMIGDRESDIEAARAAGLRRAFRLLPEDGGQEEQSAGTVLRRLAEVPLHWGELLVPL
jgi:D-glycero-D-manno-heptose 1,7-bisphosphate phosphatase